MTFKDSPLFIESDLAVAQSDFLGLTSEKKKMTSEKTGFTSEKSPSRLKTSFLPSKCPLTTTEKAVERSEQPHLAFIFTYNS